MNWKQLKDRLSEFDANLDQQLAYLNDLRKRAKDGIAQQKHSASGEVVHITESYPTLELMATQEMVRIARTVIDKAEDLPGLGASTGFTFNLNVTELTADESSSPISLKDASP